MKKRLFLALTVIFFLPFLVVGPRPAHAQWAVFDGADVIQNTITAIATPSSALSNAELQIKSYVLDPLAHALAQAVLKQITASVVNAINGTNGSPQFVQNLAGNLQKTGDQVGLSFIAQFTKTSNSPYAPAIGSSLQQNYLQNTSLAGFFASNQCTLSQSSPNFNSWVSGNFTQGGWSTWFALTTQNQNNPYTLYATANGQLTSTVGNATTTQRQTIAQNNGFLSWCSSGSTDTSGAGVGQSCSDFTNSSDCNGSLVCIQTPGKTTGTCQAPTSATSDDTASTCYNKDGTPGTVDTPGSVIENQLTTSLGSGVASLVSVHDFNQMVDTILSALATKIVTTGLAALSGSPSTPGSLSNTGTASTTSTDPNAASVASQATSLAQNVISQLGDYTSAWQTIEGAANTASSTVTSLMNACPSLAGAADTALLTEIQPVLNNAQAAFASASSTQALALQVESDANGYTEGAPGAVGALTADSQALEAAPPTSTDIGTAEGNAQTSPQATSATSTSPYVLTVTGGTTVDQMNLISKNALNALPFCGPPLLPI